MATFRCMLFPYPMVRDEMATPPQKSLLDRLGDIFFGEDEPIRAGAAAPPDGRSAPPDIARHGAQLGHPQGRLEGQPHDKTRHDAAGHFQNPTHHAPALPGRLPAGTMQLLGLTGLRQSLGPAWAENAEKVYRIVDNVLRRRLDVTDAFYKVDEETYLVLFTRLDRPAAGFKAKVIADEVERLALGELPDGNRISVLSAVAEVDRGMILEKIQSLPDLVRYVRAASAAELAAPPAVPVAPGEVLLFGEAPETADSEPADGGANATAPAVTGAGPDLADLDQSLSGLFQRKTVAMFLKECRAGFQPCFSLKRRSFSVFFAVAMHGPSGRPAHLVHDPLLETPEELPFQIDRYVLTSGLLGLHRMLGNGERGLVILNAAFSSLAQSRQREAYFARLREVPSGVAKYLGFSLRDIPPGTPASRVAEIMAYLQPFGGTRLLHIGPDFHLIDSYAGSGCHGVVTAMPHHETDLAKRFQQLGNFTKRAQLHHLESILAEAGSQDDVSAGVAAGFTYLLGDAIAPILDTPGLVRGLRSDHILRPTGG